MDPREQIKAKIDIVPFIQEFIPLRQMGRNFKTACPFHGEKTPSFVVSPERQIWHCFGCGKGGDVFTFLMEYEKMDFVEALRLLAKRTGVALTTMTPSKGEAQRERLLAINHLASEFYHYLLMSHSAGKKAMRYLLDRGLHTKTMETFKIGFAPQRWDLLLNYLTRKKGFAIADIEEAGLIIKSNKHYATNNTYYDRFRGRVMFPLKDHRGNVLGFAGRVLDPQAKEAKYVNSPETPLYHKGELFFGLDVAKEAIKKENVVIIVEGEFDMIQSFQAGVPNVVALKGTAFTLAQVKLLRRFTQHIVLALDMDLAGDAAARRSIEIADSEGLSIKVIQIKDGKDPDELIRNAGSIGWKKAIKEAISVYDFLIDSALNRFDKKTPEGKKSITEEVMLPLSAITNEIIKAHFVKRLAQELEVSEDAVMREMERLQKKQVVGVISPVQPKAKAADRQELLEEYFLALLLQKGDIDMLKTMIEEKGTLVQNPLLQKIFEHLREYTKTHITFSIASFVEALPKELVPAVDRLYLLDTESIDKSRIVDEITRTMHALRVAYLKKEMTVVTKELRVGEANHDEEAIALLEKKFHLLSSELNTLLQKVAR